MHAALRFESIVRFRIAPAPELDLTARVFRRCQKHPIGRRPCESTEVGYNELRFDSTFRVGFKSNVEGYSEVKTALNIIR
jgi:hypothetical protein